MATHSSILAWKMPCTEEPGGLQSRASQRVRQSVSHTCMCVKGTLSLFHSIWLYFEPSSKITTEGGILAEYFHNPFFFFLI